MGDQVSQEAMSEGDQVSAMLDSMGDGTASSGTEDSKSSVGDFEFPSGDAGDQLLRLVGEVQEEAPEEPAPTETAAMPQEAEAEAAPTDDGRARDPDSGRFISAEQEYKAKLAEMEKVESQRQAQVDLQQYSQQMPPQYQMIQQQQQQQQQYDPYGDLEEVDPRVAAMNQQLQQQQQQLAHLQQHNQAMANWQQQQEDVRAAGQLNQETVNALSALGVKDRGEMDMMRGLVLSKYHAVSGSFTPAYLAKEVVNSYKAYAAKAAQTQAQHQGENLRVAGRQPGASAKPKPEDHPIIKNFGDSDDWSSGLEALKKQFGI